MEVWEHEIHDDRLPSDKLHLSVALPGLNSVTEPTFDLFITFETNLPRIPLMGIYPHSVTSCTIDSEDFLHSFVKDFILFKRDFLDKLGTIKKNDVLRIQFKRKLHDQFGVRFFFESGRDKWYSDWYLLGLSSERTLMILDQRKNFKVLTSQAYTSYVTCQQVAITQEFECAICFDHFFPNQMAALPCGHIFCESDASKLSNCAICTKPKEPLHILKVRDGPCPLDKCSNSKELYMFLPCCCVIAHDMDSILITQCPYTTCKGAIERTQKLFYSAKV